MSPKVGHVVYPIFRKNSYCRDDLADHGGIATSCENAKVVLNDFRRHENQREQNCSDQLVHDKPEQLEKALGLQKPDMKKYMSDYLRIYVRL